MDSEKNFLRAWQLMSDALGAGYEAEAEYHAIYALFYGELLNLCKRGSIARSSGRRSENMRKISQITEKTPYLPSWGRQKCVYRHGAPQMDLGPAAAGMAASENREMRSGRMVSIVVPVYNVERHLDACVQSALRLKNRLRNIADRRWLDRRKRRVL